MCMDADSLSRAPHTPHIYLYGIIESLVLCLRVLKSTIIFRGMNEAGLIVEVLFLVGDVLV